MPRVRNDHLGVQPFPHDPRDAVQPLLGRDGQAGHDEGGAGGDLHGRRGDAQPLGVEYLDELFVGRRPDAEARRQEGEGEEERPDRLELPVPVRVIVVGGQAAYLHGPQRDKVGEEIGEGMPRVGDEGAGVARDAHGGLPHGQDEVHQDSKYRDAVGVVVSPHHADGRHLLQRRGVLDDAPAEVVDPGQRALHLAPTGVEEGQDRGGDGEQREVRLGNPPRPE
mmetsp:Transcript_18288/g.52803  ORF Transcript_18288/g.52803 Transcript_18288/m.52803 type:complete len:223 (-) Transcript_18288:603-1271(-)